MLGPRISFVILTCLFCGCFSQTTHVTVLASTSVQPSTTSVAAATASATAITGVTSSTAPVATTSATVQLVTTSTTSVAPTTSSGQQLTSVAGATTPEGTVAPSGTTTTPEGTVAPSGTTTNNTGSSNVTSTTTTATTAGPITCYKCSGKDCIPLEGKNNTGTCTGQFCWSYYNADDSSHVRGCGKDGTYFNQDKCSSEEFKYVTGLCSRCCTSNDCNSVELPNQKECSGVRRLSVVMLLYLSSVLTAIYNC